MHWVAPEQVAPIVNSNASLYWFDQALYQERRIVPL
jgi:hypothetical protein